MYHKEKSRANYAIVHGVQMSALSCTSLASWSNSNKELVFSRQRQQTQAMTENIHNYSMLKWKQEEVFKKLTSLAWWRPTPHPIRSGLPSLTRSCDNLSSHCCSPCLRIKLSVCPSRCLYFPCSDRAGYSRKWRPLTLAFPGGTTLLSLMIQGFLDAGPVCVGTGDLEDKKKQVPLQWPMPFAHIPLNSSSRSGKVGCLPSQHICFQRENCLLLSENQVPP